MSFVRRDTSDPSHLRKLTLRQLETLPPGKHGPGRTEYKLLKFVVSPTGRRHWEYAYRFPRGRKGGPNRSARYPFPDTTMAGVRLAVEGIRKQVRDGVDPNGKARQTGEASRTFRAVVVASYRARRARQRGKRRRRKLLRRTQARARRCLRLLQRPPAEGCGIHRLVQQRTFALKQRQPQPRYARSLPTTANSLHSPPNKNGPPVGRRPEPNRARSFVFRCRVRCTAHQRHKLRCSTGCKACSNRVGQVRASRIQRRWLNRRSHQTTLTPEIARTHGAKLRTLLRLSQSVCIVICR